MKRLLLCILGTFLISTSGFSADYFWVGGTGDWSDLTNWSSTSGGTGGSYGSLPGLNDIVYFDNNSFTAGDVVTFDETSATIKAFLWTSTTAASFSSITSNNLFVRGSFVFSPNMTNNFLGVINLNATSTTVDDSLKTGGNAFLNDLVINGAGTYILLDNLTITNGSLRYERGGFDISTRTITTPRLISATLLARNWTTTNAVINLNGSNTVLEISASSAVTATGLNTATINTTYSGLDTVIIIPGGLSQEWGTYTTQAVNHRIERSFAVNTLNIQSVKSFEILPAQTLKAGTVNTQTTCGRYTTIYASNGQAIVQDFGTAWTVNYVRLKNIEVSAGTYTANNSIDDGGNSGWTINERPGSTTYYWIAGAGDYYDSTHWSLTSGGASANCIPGPSDIAIFDANSGFVAGDVLTLHEDASLNTMNWSALNVNVTFEAQENSVFFIRTSLLGSPNLTFDWNGHFEFATTNPQIDITTNAGDWNVDFVVSNTNLLRILDDFTHSAAIRIIEGGFNSNANNVTLFNLDAVSELADLTFNFSNSEVEVRGEFFMFEANSLTWNATPSTIEFSTLDNYAVQFMAADQIYDTVIVSAKNLDLFGSNTFSHLLLTPGTSISIENNSIQTFDTLTADGTCTERIQLRSFNNALPPAQLTRSTDDTTYTSFLLIDYIDTDTTNAKRYFAADSDTLNGASFWNVSSTSSGTTYYWVGDAGNWSDINHWSLASGGTPATCLPSFMDTVIFDNNSFTLANQIIIVDVDAYFKVMDWSTSTNTPTLQLDRNLIAGDDVLLETGLTVLSNGSESGLIFQPKNLNALFDPADCNFGVGIVLGGSTVTDSLTFIGNLAGVDLSSIIIFGGFLNTNGYTVQTGTMTILLDSPKRIDLGNSLVTLEQGFSDQSDTGSLTFNAQTSTITVGGTVANNYLETTDLAFNNVILNYSDEQFNPVTGNNSFVNLTVNAGSKITILSGTSQTISNDFILAGTCNDSIYIQTDVAGANADFIKTADSVQAQCVNMIDIHASGGGLFKTYFSTDQGNNTGWTFDATPSSVAGVSSFGQLCFGDTSTFINTSTSFDGDYNNLSFEWNFGDGETHIGDTAQHVFGISGNVDVTLISEYLNGCRDTVVETITILNPAVTLSSTAPSGIICSQREVTFTGSTIPSGLDMEFFVNGTSQGLLTAGANNFITSSLVNQDTISLIAYQGVCVAELDSSLVFTVLPIPTMNITSNPASTTICEADAIDFTATSADNYRFHKNGSPLGLYSATNTITLTDIANGDQIYVIGRTDSTLCTNSSDTITFTVNPRPSTTLSQSDADQIICDGESVTFTSGGAATYQYRINGIAQTAFIGDTWTTTALTNGDVVSVLGRTAAGCEFVAPQTFSYIVNPIPTTTITSSDADLTICQGENVQFSSTGASTYQLFVNGVGLGTPTGTPVFNTTTLNDNDVVYIQGSSSGCNGNSPSITFTVNPIPSVLLNSSDADNTICFGENVDFTATGATNYEFFVAGTSQGPVSTANTFSSTTLLSGQNITVVGESLGCSANASLTFVVNPSPNPSLISNVPSNQVCEGTSVTYTASNAATYEFFVNGVSQGAPSATNSLTFTPSAPGASVNILGYNANGCFANSNTINTIVTPLPIVSLASSDADDIICQGEQIEFTAGGASNYQFLLNGISQGLPSTNNVFSTASIADGQTITVQGFNGNCSALSAQSYTITVNPIPIITLSSSDIDNLFCEGEAVSITASGATNYEFLINGISQGPPSAVDNIDLSGVASGTITITAIGESLGCSAEQNINQLINPLPTVTLVSSEASNTFCSGTIAQFTANGASSYDFYVNGMLVESNLTGLYQSTSLNDNDIVSVEGSSVASCNAATTPSITVTMLTTPIVTLNASQLTTACIGDEITFTANGATNYEFFVNGNSVSGPSANNTYITTNISNGQSVSVVGESAGCAASGNQTLTYQVFNYPVVTLFDNNAAPNLCVGDATDFSATGADEYLFAINGVAQGVFDANNTYNSSLSPGDVITVQGITNGCVSEAPQSFAPTVYNYPTPNLTSTDSDNEICLGESVNFTATGAMEYELLIDGISQGIGTDNTWLNSSLENGQVVTLNGYNGTCLATAPEVLTFTVLSMDLSLTSTPSSFMLCEGEDLELIFTGADEYEVFVNTVSQGGSTTSNTITLNNLVHNDIVQVVGLSTTTGCLQSFENDIYVQVLSTPEITINGPNTFCEGDSVELSSNWLTYNYWYQDGLLIDDSGINEIYVSESGDYSLDVSYGGNSEVWSMGNNGYGVFGNGDNFNSSTPVKANNLAEIIKLSSGAEFSTAIDVNGALWIWGLNSSGQLGLGTFTSTNSPEINVNIPQVADVAAGYDFVVAVDINGNVFSWGQNEFGQLGLGNTQVYNFPQFVASLNDVVAVSAGRKHTIALKNDGTVWTVGDNEFGQLGNGSITGSTTFGQVPGLTNIESIEAGEYSSFAISDANELFAWGNNSEGQLGMGDLNNRVNATLSSIKNVIEVSSGLAHTAVVTHSGKLYTFGSNNYGQLGTGDLIQSNSPVLVEELNGINTVRAGAHHTLIKRNDNSLWGAGRNNNNQLGDLPTSNIVSFERLQNVQGVTEMEAGLNFSQFVYGLNTSCVSQPVTIEVLDNPVATITLIDGMLEANEGVSYQWFIEGNIIVEGTNQTQLPSQSGNYTVLVTYASGCSSLSEPFAYNIASIPGEDDMTFINLYPNPTSSGSYIEWSETVIVKSVRVSDISGREVMEIKPEINSTYIDMELYPVGMYNVTLIFENNGKYNIKLVKQY